MKTRLPFFREHVLALVPDSRGIELVRLQVRGQHVRAMERVYLPLNTENGSPPADRLREELERHQWQRLPALVSLRSEHLAIRGLRFETSPGIDRVRRQVASHTKEFEALSGNRAVCEYLIGSSGSAYHLLMFTVREDLLHRELKVARDAGLRVAEVLPFILAQYAGMQEAIPSPHALCACVHTGEDKSEWIVGRGPRVFDVRSQSISGRHLAQEQSDASTLHNDLHTDVHTDVHSAGDSPMFEQWLLQLKTWLEDFRRTESGTVLHPRRLLLSGLFVPGSAQLRRMAEVLDLSVEVIPAPDGPSTAAIGLSRARVSLEENQRISFLPPEFRHAVRRIRNLFLWYVVCGLCVLSLVAFSMHLRDQIRWLQAVETGMQRQLSVYEDLEAQRLELAVRLEDRMDSVIALRTAKQNFPRLARLLKHAHAARDDQDWFVLVADAHSYFSGAPLTRLPLDKLMTVDHLILEGYTYEGDLSTVRKMIEALRLEHWIDTVDLLPDDQIRTNLRSREPAMTEGLRRFALEIRLMGDVQ